MKIHAFFICYNDAEFIPFVIDHYGQFCEKMTFFDNQSTDDTAEAIRSFPNTEVIPWHGNGLDDILHVELQNQCWKVSRGTSDWVIVADPDEFIYCRNIKERLSRLTAEGYTIVKPDAYDMVSEIYPKPGSRLTETIRRGVKSPGYCKWRMFNPNQIEEINYLPGAHVCNPTGNVKLYDGPDIKLLHYKWLTIERYMARNRDGAARQNKIHLANGLGIQLAFPEEKQRSMFYDVRDRAEEIEL